MSAEPASSELIETPDVSWASVTRFVRQLGHDLRNQLNVMELQVAYVAELTADTELQDEIKRLRGMISDMSSTLQKISTSLSHVRLEKMSYKASEFVEDLQNRIGNEFPEENAAIEWVSELGDETLDIDPQHLQEGLLEIFRNIFQHGREEGSISVTAKTEGDCFTLTLREPKAKLATPPEGWGREPLQKVSHGHYGLGLHRARVIIETHQGHLEARHEAPFLRTTITLPLSPAVA